uniref:Ninjurin-1 n=1 Tax=Timema monikensis TaxID=170555 RepID=A0A7R9E256_9NEOP|nr:unnamed protein product [Timema monikensis]
MTSINTHHSSMVRVAPTENDPGPARPDEEEGEESGGDLLQPEDEAKDPEAVEEVTVVSVDVNKKFKLKTAPTLANTYAAKKTVAQGMMDIALITSNSNQLRYLLEFGSSTPTFYFTMFLIVISLLLQIAVGVSLIFKGRYDLGGTSKMEQANRLNNYVVVGVFMVTIINVFIAAFSITADGSETTAVRSIQAASAQSVSANSPT